MSRTVRQPTLALVSEIPSGEEVTASATEADYVLTEDIDIVTGGAADETIIAAGGTLNFGDVIDGGGGNDTLILTDGGAIAISDVESFVGVETIQGSQFDDYITITADQLRDVKLIDGGEHDPEWGGDRIFITGSSIDLTGKIIENVEIIYIYSDDATITLDDIATAKLVDGSSSKNDKLVLTKGILTDAERQVLHDRGVDTIVDESGRETTNTAPVLGNLNGDAIKTSAGGTVLIDAGSNVTIDSDDAALSSLSLISYDGVDFQLGIQTKVGEIELSDGLNWSSKVSIDGVEIGYLSSLGQYLGIEFNENATVARVQKLLSALTYTNLSSDPDFTGTQTIEISVSDKGRRTADAVVSITVDPNEAIYLTDGIDNLTGTAVGDVFRAAAGTITDGDRLDGGEGNDTLQLAAGVSDLTKFATLTNIELLRGSSGNDTIMANVATLAGFYTLQGGRGLDKLHLAAGTYDLRGKVIAGIEEIMLQDNGSFIFDDYETALLARGTADKVVGLTLQGASFTETERAQLFRRGITTITDASGTYTNAAPDQIGLDGSSTKEISRAGTLVGILSAEDSNSNDTSFTYEIVGDGAGGRFKIIDDGGVWKVVVANGLLLDYEQAKTHTIRVKVTDKGGAGLFFEKDFVISVEDKSPEIISGSSASDVFVGGASKDTFRGNGGNDTLNGGKGNDMLYGGTGSDKFVFDTAPNSKSNKDSIKDWSAKYDTIQLENAIFTSLKKTGTLKKAYFVIGSSAKDSNDYVGYDKTTGDLWYDSNGKASGGKVIFANIGKHKMIHNTDFVVI